MTHCSQTWALRFGGAHVPECYDLTLCPSADRKELVPADRKELVPFPQLKLDSRPRVGWPAFGESTLGLVLPSQWLGTSESPESCSSCSKLSYIHQPGASTAVPRAFPALIRIFLFSLGEGGQPRPASVTLPGART